MVCVVSKLGAVLTMAGFACNTLSARSIALNQERLLVTTFPLGLYIKMQQNFILDIQL
jgi:hypothetical protein